MNVYIGCMSGGDGVSPFSSKGVKKGDQPEPTRFTTEYFKGGSEGQRPRGYGGKSSLLPLSFLFLNFPKNGPLFHKKHLLIKILYGKKITEFFYY